MYTNTALYHKTWTGVRALVLTSLLVTYCDHLFMYKTLFIDRRLWPTLVGLKSGHNRSIVLRQKIFPFNIMGKFFARFDHFLGTAGTPNPLKSFSCTIK